MTEHTTEIIIKQLSEIKPYENNPRNITPAVNSIKESIMRYGFVDPIYVDSNNIIIIGHARYQAAKELEIEEVPVIVDIELPEDKKLAYRLVDNKVHESSYWTEDLLQELKEFSDLKYMQQFFPDFKLDNYDKKDFINRTNEQIKEAGEERKKMYAEFTLHKQNEMSDVICPKCNEGFSVKKSDVINEIKYGKGILNNS